MTNDWRIETDAEDYFQNQKKTLSVADRRPVIRKASDLVGPGIDAQAVGITDMNAEIATFNGFFSINALISAAIPNPVATQHVPEPGQFVVVVTSDDEMGGSQTATSLSTGEVWTRVFLRHPASPSTILYQSWKRVSGIHPGTILMFGGSSTPAGYLPLTGSSAAVCRTQYAALFAAIGTTWGPGDGVTTFDLPSFSDRKPMGPGLFGSVGDYGGAMTRTLSWSHLPSHDHAIAHGHTSSGSTGSAGAHTHVLNYSANTASNNMIPQGQGASNIVNTSSNAVDPAGAHSHSVSVTVDSYNGRSSTEGLGEEFFTNDPHTIVNFIIKY